MTVTTDTGHRYSHDIIMRVKRLGKKQRAISMYMIMITVHSDKNAVRVSSGDKTYLHILLAAGLPATP